MFGFDYVETISRGVQQEPHYCAELQIWPMCSNNGSLQKSQQPKRLVQITVSGSSVPGSQKGSEEV